MNYTPKIVYTTATPKIKHERQDPDELVYGDDVETRFKNDKVTLVKYAQQAIEYNKDNR